MNCIIHLALFGRCGFLLANDRLAGEGDYLVATVGSENQVPREVQCIRPAITCCLFRFRRGAEIGKGGPLLAAKISPGTEIFVTGHSLSTSLL